MNLFTNYIGRYKLLYVFFFLCTTIGYSQKRDCQSLKNKEERNFGYGKADNDARTQVERWCGISKPTAYTRCLCENARKTEELAAKKATARTKWEKQGIEAKNMQDKANELQNEAEKILKNLKNSSNVEKDKEIALRKVNEAIQLFINSDKVIDKNLCTIIFYDKQPCKSSPYLDSNISILEGLKERIVNFRKERTLSLSSSTTDNDSSSQQTKSDTGNEEKTYGTLEEKKARLNKLQTTGKTDSPEAKSLRQEIYTEERKAIEQASREANKPIELTDEQTEMLAEGIVALGEGIGVIGSMDFGNADKQFEIRLAYGFRTLIRTYEGEKKYMDWSLIPELEFTKDLGQDFYLDVHAKYLSFNFEGYGVLFDNNGDANQTEIPLNIGVNFYDLFTLGTAFQYSSLDIDYDKFSQFSSIEKPTFTSKVNYGLYFTLEKRLYKKFFFKAKFTHLFLNLKEFDLERTPTITKVSLQAGIGLLHAGANYQNKESIFNNSLGGNTDVSEPSLDVYLGLRLPL